MTVNATLSVTDRHHRFLTDKVGRASSRHQVQPSRPHSSR